MLALRIIEHLDLVEYILPRLGRGFIGLASYPFALEHGLPDILYQREGDYCIAGAPSRSGGTGM